MRMLNHGLAVWTVVAVAIGAATSASAQTSPPAPPQPPPSSQAAPNRSGRSGGRGGQAPAVNVTQAENQVQQVWNTFVLQHSRAALQVTDAQWPMFFAKLTDLQNLRDRRQAQRRRMINELNRLAPPANEGTADDATLDGRVKQLQAFEAQAAEQELQIRADIDAMLTPFQRARFRVFEENMERQYLEMLAKVMGAR